MKFFILLLLSFPALSFNDWLIECRGNTVDGKLITISDERINGDKKNRIVRVSQWSSRREMDWSHGGRQYVESRNIREDFFFIAGRRVNYKLSYLTGFSKLPSQEQASSSEPNSLLQMDFYQGISTSTPLVNSLEIDLSCYYKRGGE